ncbi:MAG: type II toxin-antitoxin system HipA family toxin [Acidimicrobiales bacterium]
MAANPTSAFVWAWLPDATEPVVAGRVDEDTVTGLVTFTYGRSYLGRSDAMALFLPDLPLEATIHYPVAGRVPGPIADASPDAWGRRVIERRQASMGRTTDLGFVELLLESGSDRFGALDFQVSSERYVPRLGASPSLDDLAAAADLIEAGLALPAALDDALLHGSSIGGARPKAVVAEDDRQFIAKFASSTDPYPVVQSEFVAMRLAAEADLDVAPVQITSANGRPVLLVERFDRPGAGRRRAAVTVLTILGLDELDYQMTSYASLADIVRARFSNPAGTLREIFARITFNIMVGNNDDHARNHAAFWDGSALALTPAYDVCPQLRAGGETAQAMAIGRDGYRYAQLAGCVDRAHNYLLDEAEARAIIDRQLDVIRTNWDATCDQAQLTEIDRTRLWQRQILNPYALERY